MIMSLLRQQLSTEKLDLVVATLGLAAPLATFFSENREHLEPWSPPMSSALFNPNEQGARLKMQREAFDQDRAWQWYLTLKQQPNKIVGSVQVSQIHRGAFQSAMLGYSLAKACEGKGLMSEAVTAVIEEVFSVRGKLHRIQANAMTTNERSLALLDRLGFVREGLAPRYLYINGAWRDHYTYSLINPGYPPDRIL